MSKLAPNCRNLPKPIHVPLELLREKLTYDPEEGVVRWSHSKKVLPYLRGEKFGYITASGYIKGGIESDRVFAHRLAWMLHYGEDPGAAYIDHIDYNGLNNRIDNLRLADNAENVVHRRPKGLFNGVKKLSDGWSAEIKRFPIGLTYPSKEAAARAYDRWARFYYKEFANLNFPEEDFNVVEQRFPGLPIKEIYSGKSRVRMPLVFETSMELIPVTEEGFLDVQNSAVILSAEDSKNLNMEDILKKYQGPTKHTYKGSC